MPEPDFDQIARVIFDPVHRLTHGVHDMTITPEFAEELRLRSAEQLRLIWNARGAADLATLEAFRLFPEDPDVAPRATRKTIDRALRSLDR